MFNDFTRARHLKDRLAIWLLAAMIPFAPRGWSADNPTTFELVMARDSKFIDVTVKDRLASPRHDLALPAGDYYWRAKSESGQRITGSFHLGVGARLVLTIATSPKPGVVVVVGELTRPSLSAAPVTTLSAASNPLPPPSEPALADAADATPAPAPSEDLRRWELFGTFDAYVERSEATAPSISGSARNLGFSVAGDYNSGSRWHAGWSYVDRAMAITGLDAPATDDGLSVPRYSAALDGRFEVLDMLTGVPGRSLELLVKVEYQRLPYLGVETPASGPVKVRTGAARSLALGIAHAADLAAGTTLRSKVAYGRDPSGRSGLLDLGVRVHHVINLNYGLVGGLTLQDKRYSECTLVKNCEQADYRLQEFALSGGAVVTF